MEFRIHTLGLFTSGETPGHVVGADLVATALVLVLVVQLHTSATCT